MTDTASAAPSDRERFETWAKERCYRLDRSTGGGYLYGQAAIAWRAWQAACAQPMPVDTAGARWYMVNKLGMATLCADREDAEREATEAQTAWPTAGPHLAVQLVEVGCTPPAVVEPMTDGLLQQHNRDSQELRRLCAARDQARSERDALKAEIAGLEASCSTLGRLVDELRPDAERLEWVLRRCAGSWLRAYLGVVSDTSDMDTLRTLIDANRGALAAHRIGVKKGDSHG